MKYDITDAILELKPGAVWTLSGDNYIGLTWLDSKQNKPTEEEIDNKISELHDSEAMRLLRIERNKKLSECDWRVLADVLQSSKFKEWINYRQALRDLPSSATPKLDSSYDLDLTSVTWPTEPS